MRLSFLPVLGAIDVDKSTSRVFLTPSGVSSKAQANTRANGNPSAIRRISDLKIQSGAPNVGNRTSPTWNTSQPTTI